MEYVKLSDVAKIDRTVASEQECKSLPYVGLEHIQKETGRFSDNFKRIPEQLLATKFKFTSAHVLYGKLRPYLNKVARPNFEGVCTTEILPLLPEAQKLDRDFLWTILLTRGFVDWASRNISGANLPRLDPKVLANYEIPLPPLEEQMQIAAIARKCDRLRRTRRFTQQLSDTYLQSVFLRMFGDLEVNTRQWEFKDLESISDIASGITKGQKFNGKMTVSIPYLRVANVQDGYLDLSKIKLIETLASVVEDLKLQFDDVLMTEGGDFDKLGRGAIWKGQIRICVHQNHIFRVRMRKDVAIATFFAAFLQTRFAKDYFLRCSKQTTNLATINITQLKKLPVPIPPLCLQEKFTQVVQRFERLRAQQRKAERQAEHLFQTVLHRAFRGEL